MEPVPEAREDRRAALDGQRAGRATTEPVPEAWEDQREFADGQRADLATMEPVPEAREGAWLYATCLRGPPATTEPVPEAREDPSTREYRRSYRSPLRGPSQKHGKTRPEGPLEALHLL